VWRRIAFRSHRRINMRVTLTPEIINAAIQGFEAQKQHLDAQIAELRAGLNGAQPNTAAGPQKSKRRTIRAVGRKRIAEAQRQRWAVLKGASEPAMTQPPKRKRRLSPAGRAAILAALKKRWALKRAAAEKPEAVAARRLMRRKAVVRKAA
jgi:hypothetical protein